MYNSGAKRLNNAGTMWKAYNDMYKRNIFPKSAAQIPQHDHVINVNSILKTDKNPNENM